VEEVKGRQVREWKSHSEGGRKVPLSFFDTVVEIFTFGDVLEGEHGMRVHIQGRRNCIKLLLKLCEHRGVLSETIQDEGESMS
jgi:hypothetical protein